MKESNELNKELKELFMLIKRKVLNKTATNNTFGYYRYMAKLDALENILIKKKVITKKGMFKEMIQIIRCMKGDFKR